MPIFALRLQKQIEHQNINLDIFFFQKSPGSGTPPQFPSTPIKSSSKANSTTSLGPSASEQPQPSEISNEIVTSKISSDIAASNDKREATPPDLISVSPVKESSPEVVVENENGDEKKDDEKESENEKEEITVEVNTKE